MDNDKFTPEQTAEALYRAELRVVRAERKVEQETDPKKQIEYLKSLAKSIRELENINGALLKNN